MSGRNPPSMVRRALIAVLTTGALMPTAASARPAPVLAPGAASARSTQAFVILPPGEGSTITLAAYAHNQATGSCSDLGANVCDQLRMYENWRFRNGNLS